MIRIENILTPGRSLVNAPGGSKKKVLEQIASLISREVPDLDEQTVYESLIAREKLGSTGFGNGIAIPHCRINNSAGAVGALITLTQPIEFDSIDSEPVDILFAMLVPEEAHDEHLKNLAALAGALTRSEFRQRLRAANDHATLYQAAIA